MIKSVIILLFGYLIASAPGFASTFDEANAKYSAGDFSAAAAAYEKLLSSEGPRASVYYNLGNSYQQLKQYGQAILAYERARLLTPRDPDLLANLARARKAAAAFEEPVRHPWLDAALNLPSLNEWSWLLAGSALSLGALAIVAGILKRARRKLAIAACVNVCLIAVAGTALYLRKGDSLHGIVLTDTAAVRLSPFEKAEALGTPGPGRMVILGDKSGDFQYVEVPATNLKGWLASKDVAAILPQDFNDVSAPAAPQSDSGFF
jgi:tetratricopeptide (TPR) repeat protein